MFNVKDLAGFTMNGPEKEAAGKSYSFDISSPPVFQTTLTVSPELLKDDSFWESVAEKLKTLLFNKIGFEQKVYGTRQDVLDFINNHFPRLTPQDKELAILEWLHSLTTFDGDMIDLDRKELSDNNTWRTLYLNHEQELGFYLSNMKEDLIDYETTTGFYEGVRLTVKGLAKIGEFLESKNSNICFVAMSFDPSLDLIYDQGIEPAIIECGYRPMILRKENIDSSVTINDAIIANIKKAHFTIADFTGHRASVYFEAGYALGRGQKVIYICRREDIANAQFDTRNYQHILWTEAADLRKKLVDKIEAYIKS